MIKEALVIKGLPVSEIDCLPPGLTDRCKHLKDVSTDELKDNRVQEVVDNVTNILVVEESSVSSPLKSPDIPYHGGIGDPNISDLTLRDDVNEPLIDNESNAVNDFAMDLSLHEFVDDVRDNAVEADSSATFSLKSPDIPYHDVINYLNQVSSNSLCRPPETMYSGMRRGHWPPGAGIDIDPWPDDLVRTAMIHNSKGRLRRDVRPCAQ